MPSLASIRDYILPVAAPIVGGAINRRAAGNASAALQGGVNNAMGTIQAGADRAAAGIQGGADAASRTLADVYAQQRKDLDPFRTAGTGALDSLSKGTAEGGEFNRPFSMADFELYRDPMFNWRVQQGERAIKAGANAGGVRFSGATLKALSDYNSKATMAEEASAYGRYQDDLQGRFNRAADVAGASQNAANQTVNAGGTYGANLANLQTGTSRSLADLQRGTADQIAGLQTDLASAQAMGDVAKAGTITDAINSILQGVDNVGTARSLAALAGKVAAPAVAAAVPAGMAGLATMGAPVTAGMLSGAAATPAVLSAELAAMGYGSAAGGAGGLGATIGGLLTNPITIAAAAAIGVGLLWRKSQAHHEANEWVQGTQNDFDKNMAAINEDPKLAPEQKAELKRANVVDYMAAALDFAKKGSDQREVIGNAMRTFRQWYPEFASAAVA